MAGAKRRQPSGSQAPPEFRTRTGSSHGQTKRSVSTESLVDSLPATACPPRIGRLEIRTRTADKRPTSVCTPARDAFPPPGNLRNFFDPSAIFGSMSATLAKQFEDSASIASRVQMRATSRRISRTRELDADSAHCRHSAARSLHFSGLSIAAPSGDLPSSKIKPRLDRGDQRGFLRSASAGAKLFSKLGTCLIVPRYLTASTKNYLRVRPVFCLAWRACYLLSHFRRCCTSACRDPHRCPRQYARPAGLGDRQGPAGVPSHRWNDACLQPIPHPPQCLSRYGELRHRRRPAASCRCHFLRLGGYRIEYSAGRNSSRASGSRAGERGLSHRKAEFIETPLSKTIAKLRPVTLTR